MKTKIITIVGKSNSGKTTLLEKVIALLTRKGYKIGSVKHAHEGFEMDKKGKDSWRHRQAGASATLVITENNIALIKDDNSRYIEKMASYLEDMDIILAEGFKRQDLPKIEVFRTQAGHRKPLCMHDKNLVAFITDSDYRPDVPLFGLEDIHQVADFIESDFIKS